MTDFSLAALARKWCPSHGEHVAVEGNHLPICSCAVTTAAIREALAEAEKIASHYDYCQECLSNESIAAAIAALRQEARDATR